MAVTINTIPTQTGEVVRALITSGDGGDNTYHPNLVRYADSLMRPARCPPTQTSWWHHHLAASRGCYGPPLVNSD